jgi:hypothetical protein
MDRMTLRQAAERSSRSITTLRRYIRSGKLRAEKRDGRYGPEYYVSAEDLAAAGLEAVKASPGRSLSIRRAGNGLARRESVAGRPFDESVPISLYQDLQMKHEQLLVQYGMVRAGGLRVMELQGELESRQEKLDSAESEVTRLREELRRGTAELRRRLEQAQQELEGRDLEVAALQEKVRALEMMTRNAVTNETIEKQFDRIKDQARRVEELRTRRKWSGEERRGPGAPARGDSTDH